MTTYESYLEQKIDQLRNVIDIACVMLADFTKDDEEIGGLLPIEIKRQLFRIEEESHRCHCECEDCCSCDDCDSADYGEDE